MDEMSDPKCPFAAMCIDNSYAEKLTKGKVYTIVRIVYHPWYGPPLSYITSETENWWIPSRFEIMRAVSLVKPTEFQSAKKKPDWRMWARVRPGECPCAIPKESCNYHK